MKFTLVVLLFIPVVVNSNSVIAAESNTQEITNVFEYNALLFGKIIFVGEIEIDADLKMKLVSNVKNSVKPGELIHIESYMDLEFDEDVIEALRENDVEAISGKINGFNISNENGKEVYNAADTPLEIPKTSFPEEGPLKMRLPFEGGFETGPFTAAQEGNLIIRAGDLDGVITIYGIPILGKVDLNLSGKLAEGENSTIVEIPIEGEDNGVDPISRAVIAVNEAENVDALWKALGNETLALNLNAVEKYNTYKNTKLCERILEKRAEADGFKNVEAVQKAVNSSNFELFIQPGRPQDPLEPAFNAINNATDVEEMKVALENETLGLNLEAYQVLSSEKQTKVAELVLKNRPEDEEGYPLPNNIQEALEQAITKITESEEPDESDEIGGTWQIGEGKPNSEAGNEKDLYLDIITFDVYQKNEKDWNLIGNLKGEDGTDGAIWLVGEGYPSESLGNTGDLYLETSTGDVYIKSVDGWKVVANIQGASNETEDNEKLEENPNEDPKEGPEKEPGVDIKDGNLKEDESNEEKGEKLPSTATMYPLMILIGSLVSILGGALLYIRKKVLR